ncbi:sulfotransferase domain-containing protein [Streptomyces afghaniensis]|uniref:sulfotransferase domain-containing protein n=1 Tax=Streptomyces afghaniensis TaxID=66865 RepID=UPI00277F829E|nr:sulfotransferase domain-containing protein [Streptomyces afghaniensis]MDQ1013647.1 hypothetical protein [Streptomyces afghaniensis]
MTTPAQEAIHGLQNRFTALHRRNISRLDKHDVVVASFGGAGQSLLGNTLGELGLNYVDAYSKSCYQTARPVPRTPTRTSAPGCRHRTAGCSEPGCRHRTAGCSDAAQRRITPWHRFVKTHLPPRYFSSGPLLGAWVLVRDPRDALYSRYRFRIGYAKDPWDMAAGTFGSWLARPGPVGLTPVDDWSHFYGQWWEATQQFPSAAVTRYEDLKADPLGTLPAVLRKFGVDISQKRLAEAVDNSSFTAMSAHEARTAGSKAQAESGERVMRRGKTGVEGVDDTTPAHLLHGARGKASGSALRL